MKRIAEGKCGHSKRSVMWLMAWGIVASTHGAIAVEALPPEHVFIWPDLAPGETRRDVGEPLPINPKEQPPITRVIGIRRPHLEVYLPSGKSSEVGILILPGGGFGRVVPDLEGSEMAHRLNALGIAAFVLYYRTNEETPADEPVWRRPLQDSQRALRWLRAHAQDFHLKTDRIGLLGFSAGGQVAAIHLTQGNHAAYDALDELDRQSCRPDFGLLIYPWRVLQPDTQELLPAIRVTEETPPTFLVHTHDDQSSSLGAVEIYAALKRHNVPAELHIYENGGHGYGTRARPNSNIGTWPDRAADWLRRRGLTAE